MTYFGHDAIRELASPTMAFQDPTAPEEYGVPVLNELDPFLEFMAAAMAGETKVEFTHSYASNDQVVLAVGLSGTMPAASVGLGDGEVSFTSDGVSVLHVVDDLVVSHTDYMNYSRLAGSFKPVE